MHDPYDSNRIKIYFLRYVFLLDCRYSQWISLCEQVKTAQNEILLLDEPDLLIQFTRLMDRVSILNKPIGKLAQNPYQGIEITLSEWEKLKTAVYTAL